MSYVDGFVDAAELVLREIEKTKNPYVQKFSCRVLGLF